MTNKYIRTFNEAKTRYINQVERPGYPNGLLTWFRHSLDKSKALISLELELNRTDEDVYAEHLIQKHLLANKFNNHSFNTYFVDQLMRDFPSEGWQQYNPKPIIFYQGTVYHGTQIKPNVAFKKGFESESSSENLDHYISDCNGGYGVSTTLNFEVARSYALPNINPNMLNNIARPIYNEGYVYEINYRGCEGVDLACTLSRRGQTFNSMLSSNKEEINIISRVKPCDIVRAWHYKRDTFKDKLIEVISNQNYLSDREFDKEPTSHLLVSSRDFNTVCDSEHRELASTLVMR